MKTLESSSNRLLLFVDLRLGSTQRISSGSHACESSAGVRKAVSTSIRQSAPKKFLLSNCDCYSCVADQKSTHPPEFDKHTLVITTAASLPHTLERASCGQRTFPQNTNSFTLFLSLPALHQGHPVHPAARVRHGKSYLFFVACQTCAGVPFFLYPSTLFLGMTPTE